MLQGFKKEVDIALHFRKFTCGGVGMDSRQEAGFKEEAHYEFLEKQEAMSFKAVNPFPKVQISTSQSTLLS